MTLPNRNPTSFNWEYTEPRGVTFPVGPDGFLEYTPPEFDELTMEVTLKFQGKELKGYTNVFEVEKKFAPTEVYLTACNGDQFPTVEMQLLQTPGPDFAWTPHHSDWDTPSSLTIVTKLVISDWNNIRQVIAAKDNFGFPGSGWRWQFGPTTPSASQFFWTPVGGDQPVFSSAPDSWTPPANGSVNWFKLVFQVLSGDTEIRHYHRTDEGDDWTLLHQDNMGSELPIINNTRDVFLGYANSPASGLLEGGIFETQFLDAEGGTAFAHFDGADFQFGDEEGAVAVDRHNKAWTLAGNGVRIL
jgi:hypothetical protein